MRYKKIKLAGGKTMDEHRLIMQEHLGRTLDTNEVVHHIDENKLNNSIENLEVMSRSEHSSMHSNNEENIKRLISVGVSCHFKKGRCPQNRSLTDWEAFGIKELIKNKKNESMKSLAESIGVNLSLLIDIKRGRSYA